MKEKKHGPKKGLAKNWSERLNQIGGQMNQPGCTFSLLYLLTMLLPSSTGKRRLMKHVLFIFALLAMGLQAQGQDHDLYYFGEAQITNLKSAQITKESILLKKSMHSSQNMIIEIACSKGEDQIAKLSKVYMKVQDNSLLIADSEDMQSTKLTGTGKVFGEDWNWNYLTFSMLFNTEYGTIRIEDWNYVADKKLIAHKQLFFQNNPVPFQLWEIHTAEISKEDYDILGKELHCPQQ